MGRKKIININEEDHEIDYDEVPKHLESDNTTTELNHYVEGKKIDKIKKIKTTKKK